MQVIGTLEEYTLNFNENSSKIVLNIYSNDVNTLEKLRGVKLNVELKQYREKRSLDANAYFHVLVNKLADVLNKSNQEMKIELNLKYGTLARAEDGKIMGCMIPKYVDIKTFYEYAECYKEDSEYEYYMFYKRTSELNSKEFARLLEGTVQECKQQDIETLDEIEIKRLIDEIDNSKK